MVRRFVSGLLSAIVLGFALPQSALGQSDQIPSEVSPGSDFDIIKYGVAAEATCTVWLGDRQVGSCQGPVRGPLQGRRLTVSVDHPAGSQKLSCRHCHRIDSKPPPPPPSSSPSSSSSPPVPDPATMPDLIGRTPNDAQATLKRLGWHGKWNQQDSKTTFCQPAGLPPGTISRQDPERGASLAVDGAVAVDICLPTPGLRQQPVDVAIELATITVRPVSATVAQLPPTAAPVAAATSSGSDSRVRIGLLILGALIVGALVGLRVVRGAVGHRPVMKPLPPPGWLPPPRIGQSLAYDRSASDGSTIEGVTLRAMIGTRRVVVQPAGRPDRAHSMRLEVNHDPGIQTVQEDYRDPR